MHTIFRSAGIVAAMLLLAGSRCGEQTAPTVTATARLTNSADVPLQDSVKLSYPLAATGPRVAAREGAGLTYLQDIVLSMDPVGVSTDAMYLQVFSLPAGHVSDAPPEPVASRGLMQWIDLVRGEVVTLALETPRTDSPASRAIRNLSPRRASVSAWLARVEHDDVSVPWTVEPGSAGCFPRIPTDCWDMQTIVTLLNDSIAAAVGRAFDPVAGGGADPQPLVRTRGVTLASYIPNVVPTFGGPTRRIRGVGFLYRIDLEARAAQRVVNGVDVGTPYHPVTVWLPVSLLFESDGGLGVRLTIDPFDLAGGLTGDMAARASVQVWSPEGPPTIGNAMSGVIADTVLAGVRRMFSAPLMPPTASDGLGLFFNAIRPAGTVRSDFDVVLIPSRGSPSFGAPVPAQLVPAAALTGVHLVFLE